MPFEIEMRQSLMAWKLSEIYDAVGFGWVISYSFADIEAKNLWFMLDCTVVTRIVNSQLYIVYLPFFGGKKEGHYITWPFISKRNDRSYISIVYLCEQPLFTFVTSSNQTFLTSQHNSSQHRLCTQWFRMPDHLRKLVLSSDCWKQVKIA